MEKLYIKWELLLLSDDLKLFCGLKMEKTPKNLWAIHVDFHHLRFLDKNKEDK